MLVTFLKRLSYKDLKTVKTLKIQQGSAKIWRFKVRKKSIFSNKTADFSVKIDFFRTLNRHIFALPCCIQKSY